MPWRRQTDRSIATPAKCNRWKKVGDDEFSRRRCATPGATLISKSGNSSCQSNCDW